MMNKCVHFNNALRVEHAEQAWSLDDIFDDEKRVSNREVLDGIAAIMRQRPLRLQCHGETAIPDVHKCHQMAEYFRLDAQDPRQFKQLMDRLAMHRAEACKKALVARNVDASRVEVTYEGGTGRMEVSFILLLGGRASAAAASALSAK